MTLSSRREVPLAALAEIKPGYPFRGAITADPDGEARVVQVRHLDPVTGFETPVNPATFDRVALSGKRQPDYLQPGDLLFASRGSRFFAAIVPDAIPSHTVCSPHFFLIRLTSEALGVLTPDFLAWQINHHDIQVRLTRLGQGTMQHSVSKAQLKTLPITLPSLTQQTLITAYQQAARKEANALQALIVNRDQEVRALGSAVLAEARAG